MSVTIDREPLLADKLGLRTVGQVLAHAQRDNRLVTSLLIDGSEPDLDRIGTVRQSLLNGHTVFIETTDPRQMALDVLAEVEEQLSQTDGFRAEAIDLLQRGQPSRAMEKLSGCFSAWQTAQDSVLKTSQLLRIDLESVRVWDRPLNEVLHGFAGHLRDIKSSLEQRDFVTLSDILTYEAADTSSQWRDALAAMREIIESN
jgi:hypothetical protein